MSMNKHIAPIDCWYLAQLKPNGFDRAKDNLRRQNFETFMPMSELTMRHGQKFSKKVLPVFP